MMCHTAAIPQRAACNIVAVRCRVSRAAARQRSRWQKPCRPRWRPAAAPASEAAKDSAVLPWLRYMQTPRQRAAAPASDAAASEAWQGRLLWLQAGQAASGSRRKIRRVRHGAGGCWMALPLHRLCQRMCAASEVPQHCRCCTQPGICATRRHICRLSLDCHWRRLASLCTILCINSLCNAASGHP